MNFFGKDVVFKTIGEHHDGVIGKGTTDQGLHVITLLGKNCLGSIARENPPAGVV
jgi:hypothetical protein